MLSHLTVKNLALIDHVELAFSPGLTVLTGETGAGKSIVVEALLLLLGQRASADVVRQGHSEGVVEAIWHLADDGAGVEVRRALNDADLPPMEDGQLVLRRVISKEGRHKQQVNGAVCTVAQLKVIAENLVDFTGQHAHQQLTRRDAALPLIDGFAGHDDDVRAMSAAFHSARTLASELVELRTKELEKERRLDVIRFYLDEIETLAPQPGEDVALESERRRLANASKLKDAFAEAAALVFDGDDDALSRLRQAHAALKKAARDDDTIVALCDSIESAIAVVDDVARDLNRRMDVDDDPARLEAVEDRLDALRRVMKKHGGDLGGVIAARDALAAERALLESATERIAVLESELGHAVARAAAVAGRLTAGRIVAADRLASAIERELPALGMPNARIQVVVEPLGTGEGGLVAPDGRGLSSSGADVVELRFSANAGETPAPLAKVASGGELSRVLLAVKRVLLDKDPVPVSVFDEVDAGVGGAIGEAIGEKLEAIAGRKRQVLCISHLPQIACRGESHLLVKKDVEDGRTVSRVYRLDDDAREAELARMLGGREITATTISHAKEMLERARIARARGDGAAASTPTDDVVIAAAPPKKVRASGGRRSQVEAT